MTFCAIYSFEQILAMKVNNTADSPQSDEYNAMFSLSFLSAVMSLFGAVELIARS